jgi:hypothetical protein
MISLDDPRWSDLTGGYRFSFDPRPLLQRLETAVDTTKVWEELWNELHHQGDVGDASFAAVPFLVRSYRNKGVPDWNTYAIVAIIELARKERTNPDVPQWIAEDYFKAITDLAEIGAAEVLRVATADDVRAMLSVIAIERGLRVHGKYLLDYSEDELTAIEAGIWR